MSDLYVVGFDLSNKDDMTASIGIVGSEGQVTINGEKAVELYEKMKGEINNG